MQASDIPAKYQTKFAINAGASYIRTVPQTTTDPNAASYDLGFPPNTFTPLGGGGAPPDGRDFQNLFQVATAWLQWAQAGGAPITYDATFQTEIGGYPSGAVVVSATNPQLWWRSTADNNTTNPDAGGSGWVTMIPLITGECQLQYSSSTQLVLVPKNGSTITVQGVPYPVPSGGVTLSNSGLSASTLYYIYAHISAGSLALAASTTGHATDTAASNLGVEIKAGDDSYSLVGMAYVGSGGTFSDSATQRNVASWFNRRSKKILGLNPPGSVSGVTSGTLAKLTASWDVELTCWSDDNPTACINGNVLNSAQGGSIQNITSFGLDGSLIATDLGLQSEQATVNTKNPIGVELNSVLSEGHHTLSVFGAVTGTGSVGPNSGTWSAQIIGSVEN